MNQFIHILRNSGVLFILVMTYAVFSLTTPSFFGLSSFLDLLHVVSPMIVVASGMALMVMSGKLDISVGSTAYVASAVFAILMDGGHVSIPVALSAGLGIGLVLGAINGIIVVALRIDSLIATLGTMIAFRGIGLSLTDGGLIEMPELVKPLGNAAIGPFYADTILALIVLAAVHFLHQRTSFGRQITAIGNNEDIARRIGIPIAKRTFVTLVLTGFLAALGGVMYTLQVSVNTAKIGEGMEFTAVAVVVVGGISLFGGRGNILSAVILGSLMFQVIRSGLQQVGANPYSYRLVEGVVIFIAMYADALKAGRGTIKRALIPKKT